MLMPATYDGMEIRFVGKEKKEFLKVVKQRVDAYFRAAGISRNATWGTKVKAVTLIVLMFTIYGLILSDPFPFWGMLPLWAFLGVFHGFIGINISHDALHGSFSSNQTVNQWVGYTYDLVGLSSFVWKQTHNVEHHTYTNIAGHDPDIDKPYLLRLSPHDEWHSFHRFQKWYIWLLYGFVGVNWIHYTDYVLFFRYKDKMATRDKIAFFGFKLLYNILFVLMPFLVMQAPWWQILAGYFVLQFVGGLTVALIFQLAHLVEGVKFPLPDEQLLIPEYWGVHEMMTTSNFGRKNPFLNILLGGLNFQVEHHLFPNVSHGHYYSISPIVKATAEEFSIPYNEYDSFIAAVKSHYRHLAKMGRKHVENN